MTTITSRAKLIEELRITVDDGRAHSVCLDLPKEMVTDMGPTALELGVMSFSGCVATIFALMAKKMRVPISDLEVNVKAEKPEDARTVTKADFDIIVKSSESEEKINRVWERTRANCPVGVLFEQAGVQVNYKLKIVKE
ncbi:MAG: OsmC family protein [Candidatus Bathyarchaeia archaeon]